jgi:nitrate reductase gamma subunit
VIAIIFTGNAMRFAEHFDLAITRTYFANLFTFSLTAASYPQNGMFMLHLLLAQVLIVFIPFSKIMHFGGIFFTQSLIQKS